MYGAPVGTTGFLIARNRQMKRGEWLKTR